MNCSSISSRTLPDDNPGEGGSGQHGRQPRNEVPPSRSPPRGMGLAASAPLQAEGRVRKVAASSTPESVPSRGSLRAAKRPVFRDHPQSTFPGCAPLRDWAESLLDGRRLRQEGLLRRRGRPPDVGKPPLGANGTSTTVSGSCCAGGVAGKVENRSPLKDRDRSGGTTSAGGLEGSDAVTPR